MRVSKRILMPILGFTTLTALILSLPILGCSETIALGQTRTVQGPVSAVDVEGRGLVLEVPTPKGKWTVGVTITNSTKFHDSLTLRDLKVGESIRLEYTRQNDRLIGVSISKESAAAEARPPKSEKEGPEKSKRPAKPAAKETPAK